MSIEEFDFKYYLKKLLDWRVLLKGLENEQIQVTWARVASFAPFLFIYKQIHQNSWLEAHKKDVRIEGGGRGNLVKMRTLLATVPFFTVNCKATKCLNARRVVSWYGPFSKFDKKCNKYQMQIRLVILIIGIFYLKLFKYYKYILWQ